MKIKVIIGNSLYFLSKVKLFSKPNHSSNLLDEVISGYGKLKVWEFEYPATICQRKINARYKNG